MTGAMKITSVVTCVGPLVEHKRDCPLNSRSEPIELYSTVWVAKSKPNLSKSQKVDNPVTKKKASHNFLFCSDETSTDITMWVHNAVYS